MQLFGRNKGGHSEFKHYKKNVQNQHCAEEQFLP